MKSKALILLSFISVSANAYYGPLCGVSYHSDSYGMGLKSVFSQTNSRAPLNDEGCYQAGVLAGLEALDRSSNESACKSSFNRGFKIGLQYEINSNVSNICYTSGANAGVSALQIAARESNSAVAGSECTRAYKAGRSDYFSHMSSYTGSTNKLRNCYQQGFFEAPIIP